MKIQNLFKFILLVIFSLQIQGCGGGSSGPELARIKIDITGLPDDISGDVTFSLNDSGTVTNWEIPKSTTITGLKAGTYTLRSSAVQKGLTQYKLSDGRSTFNFIQFTIAEGESLERTVDYTATQLNPGTIEYTIDKSNIPAGIEGVSVALEGPEGYYQEISENMILDNLVPGDYQVYAPDQQFQGQNYGFYFNFGFLRVGEGQRLFETAVVHPVPIRLKSISLLSELLIRAIEDEQGNKYTIQKSTTNSETFILKKWDAIGNEIWSSELTNPKYSSWIWKIVVDDNGNILLGGFGVDSNLFGSANANQSAEIVKYDAMGIFQWRQFVPGIFSEDHGRIDQISVASENVMVFSFRNDNGVKPTIAVISKFDLGSGDIQETVLDESFSNFANYWQLHKGFADDFWLRVDDQFVRYSNQGIKLESVDLVSNARIVIDPTGGFLTLQTITGLLDSDVQVTRYNSDWSINWQTDLTNTGDEFGFGITYHSATQRILISLSTSEFFPGFSKYTNAARSVVFSELNIQGQIQWIRQFHEFAGPVTQLKSTSQISNWVIKTNTPLSPSQYGKGNLIQIGP